MYESECSGTGLFRVILGNLHCEQSLRSIANYFADDAEATDAQYLAKRIKLAEF